MKEPQVEELYKMLLSERDHDSQRFWVIFGVMNVINAGMLALVGGKDTSVPLRSLTSILGVSICIVWYLSERRMAGWLDWWETELKVVESLYLDQLRQATTPVPVPKDFHIFVDRKNPYAGGLSTRKAGWLLPIFFLLAWVLLLVSPLLPRVAGWLGGDCSYISM